MSNTEQAKLKLSNAMMDALDTEGVGIPPADIVGILETIKVGIILERAGAIE